MERKQPKCVEIGPGPCLACADAQATIAALEETILKMGENAAVVAKDAMAAKEQIAALQARVRELEAQHEDLVERNRILRDRPDLPVERTSFHDEVVKLQAELERVSALVKALPKVEGEIEVSSGVYNFILLKHDSGTRFLCGQIETEQTARAIAALWQHRQGMEG